MSFRTGNNKSIYFFLQTICFNRKVITKFHCTLRLVFFLVIVQYKNTIEISFIVLFHIIMFLIWMNKFRIILINMSSPIKLKDVLDNLNHPWVLDFQQNCEALFSDICSYIITISTPKDNGIYQEYIDHLTQRENLNKV